MASTTIIISEIYSSFGEHSAEDLELVKRLQQEEQLRRIADLEGEKQRREVAHQVSHLFALNVRPTWFQKGAAYALNIVKLAQEAGSDILRSSQVRIHAASEKSFVKAQELKQRVIVTGDKAGEVSLEVAHDVKEKLQSKLATGIDAAQDVAQHGLENVQQAAQSGLGNVQQVAQTGVANAQQAAQLGLENVQQAAKKVKGMGVKLVTRLRRAVSSLTINTAVTFAVLEEESERSYRLNTELDGYALLNAFAVSRLIKDLAPALYRPAFEPNLLYGVKLLESGERSRRILRDLSDRAAINNAKAVAVLIEQRGITVASESTITATPTTTAVLPDAALVAAKAEIVDEIKVHKPIPATM